VLPGLVEVPGVGEAVPGVGEAAPGVGDAVPGVGEAVPGLLPVVPLCPGFEVVPEFCPLGEVVVVPVCPALEPAAEPADPADPACISGVKMAAEAGADWATSQQVKSNKTNTIENLVFIGPQASKRE
jgi:hypothetical protein